MLDEREALPWVGIPDSTVMSGIFNAVGETSPTRRNFPAATVMSRKLAPHVGLQLWQGRRMPRAWQHWAPASSSAALRGA